MALTDMLKKLPSKAMDSLKNVFTREPVRELFEHHPNSKKWLVEDQHLIPNGAHFLQRQAYQRINQELGTGYLDDLENALTTKNQEFMKKAPDDINKIRRSLNPNAPTEPTKGWRKYF